MCVANSARSQLAEGLARNLFPQAEIQSAGSLPGKLNPHAVKVMQEIGIDISEQYAKSVNGLSPKFTRGLDYVITLCAEEVCPVTIAGAKKLHWPLPDPASKDAISVDASLAKFREAREAISEKLATLKNELRL